MGPINGANTASPVSPAPAARSQSGSFVAKKPLTMLPTALPIPVDGLALPSEEEPGRELSRARCSVPCAFATPASDRQKPTEITQIVRFIAQLRAFSTVRTDT